jgi:hypothetical protein
MDGACLASRRETIEESLKRRNGRNETTRETTSKMDGQCTGDNNGTYAIEKNKLGYGKEQGEMEKCSFSSKKSKRLIKLKKKKIS